MGVANPILGRCTHAIWQKGGIAGSFQQNDCGWQPNTKINDRTVEHAQHFKFLGVVVNDTLTWFDHIDMVCKKVSHSLNLLCWLSWFLPRLLLLLFLKSYSLPHFDYCDVVWIGYTKAESLDLEPLLNFACSTVVCGCKRSSDTAFRCELGLSTLFSRRKFHLAQTVFKCLHSLCPSYLTQLFPTPSSSYYTQSSSSSQLNPPSTKLSFGQRAFSFAGASMWRSLPPITRQISDFRAFLAKCEDLLN